MNPESEIIRATATFTQNLYQILARKSGNVFFSPLSAHTVLSMLAQGARGDTATDLTHTLGNPDAKSTAEGYRAVIKRMNGIKPVTLLTANKIYGVKGTKFLKDFQRTIEEDFAAEVDVVELEEPKKAAEEVNKWVGDKTKGNIKNIVNEALFGKNLSLILINAVYFKGEWVSKFKENFTKSDKFHLDDEHSVDVQMMHQKGNYWHKEDEELGAQVLEMPYKGFDVKMMILLPNDNNLQRLEATLAKTDLSKLGNNLKLTDVNLFVPKFKMWATIQLNDVLSEMGLKSIFDMNKADFSGIFDTTSLKNNLYVSDVIQKAFIEVNEGGTVAAAATRATMVLGCAPGKPKPVVFKVDHPAIFLLVATHGKDKDLSNILFYGRLSHPQY